MKKYTTVKTIKELKTLNGIMVNDMKHVYPFFVNETEETVECYIPKNKEEFLVCLKLLTNSFYKNLSKNKNDERELYSACTLMSLRSFATKEQKAYYMRKCQAYIKSRRESCEQTKH